MKVIPWFKTCLSSPYIVLCRNWKIYGIIGEMRPYRVIYQRQEVYLGLNTGI
jgi:hypothetical protein